MTFPLLRPQIAQTEQPAQPPPGAPIGRVGDDIWRAIGEDEAAADDQFEIDRRTRCCDSFAQGDMGADDARHCVAVGDADADVAEGKRRRDHLVRM